MIFRVMRDFESKLWADHWDIVNWEGGGYYYSHLRDDAGNYHPFCWAKESERGEGFCPQYWTNFPFHKYNSRNSKIFGNSIKEV
jgi:hypothetical protein